MEKYIFTLEQLASFLESFCGCTLDAAGEDTLRGILEEQVAAGRLEKSGG